MDEVFYIPNEVPVFPLPEVVLFPRAVLPLHIFEPRYREMVKDALEGESVLAAALLKPGCEPLYYTRRAPIHTVVGVGQIVASERLDDGNYNLFLRGITRARVLEESALKPYRVAHIELLDNHTSAPPAELRRLRELLRRTVRAESFGDAGIRDYWLKLIDSPLELGDVADLIASGLPVEGELRQRLLEELDPAARTLQLVEHIHTLAEILRIRRTQSPHAEWQMN